MRLNIFKLKLLLEEIDHKFLIYAILTGINISRKKSTFGKSVDTDMAFSNNDETTPTTRIFDVIIRHRNNLWLYERAHVECIA